ncbi:MAG: hypothetical protein KGH98_02565 [Candidatus Micrarchaeota archaeon]|nr:hypothetical protein [Candidatus Micrarchaeota archaeon]
MAERLLTINIRKYLVTQPRNKRANKAVKYVRDRVAHYTKTMPDNVKLSKELNSEIFKRYSKSMNPVKMSVSITNDIASVTLFAQKTAPQQAAAPAKKEEKQKPVQKEQAAQKPKEKK